jgi:tetratricopeptide (TPR) repeat protein/peroxiredoxin
MKRFPQVFLFFLVLLLILSSSFGICLAGIEKGKAAPLFQEKDIEGKVYDLSTMQSKPMIILYFFDVESRPSQEMFLNLVGLSKKYADADMMVLGITRSDTKAVSQFVKKAGRGFPVLIDRSGISKAYQATMILPAVCIIGPELTVLDHFQGGGKTSEIMLVRLAERNLQRKQTTIAKAITEEVVKQNPKNTDAKTIEGYAELKEGNLEKAHVIFETLSKNEELETEVRGKEGLSAVYANKGETQKAMQIAEEVVKKAPERSFAHVVKADLLYGQNRKDEAAKEYEKAVMKKEGEAFQKAFAHNQFGRFHAGLGKYDQARRLYDMAVEIDPYYIEATSNKGMTYEKEGNWDMALTAYQKAMSIDTMDTFSSVLAKKAQEMIDLQRDAQKKERVDRLVKELAERFRSQKSGWGKKDEDTWTSRPMILSFVDFQEQGGLAERDGFSTAITTGLSSQLNATGRVQVVERVLIERLLEELNLGSSELADPETSLRLGRVLAAKLIGTGTLFVLPGGTILNLRLIDTETSAIAKVFSRQYPSMVSFENELNRLNRQILDTIHEKYPLRGFVVQADKGQIMINLGSKQGVSVGTHFEVLEEQKPITYKGKKLQPTPKPIAVIKINHVEQDFSFASVVSQDKPFKADAKVQEKIDKSPLVSGGFNG